MVRGARRCFIAGSIGLLLSGLAHFYGQFGGGEPGPARAFVEAGMRATRGGGLGMEFSLMDVMQCWGVFFGVLAILAGVQNLIAAGAVGDRARPIALLSLASTFGVGALLAIALHYRIAPPALVYGVVVLLFAAASVLAIRADAG